MWKFIFGGSGGAAGGGAGGSGGSGGSSDGDGKGKEPATERAPSVAASDDAMAEDEAGMELRDDDVGSARKRLRPDAKAVPAVIVCDHPACVKKPKHCAVCSACLGPEEKRVAKLRADAGTAFVCVSCVPADMMPRLVDRLYRMMAERGEAADAARAEVLKLREDLRESLKERLRVVQQSAQHLEDVERAERERRQRHRTEMARLNELNDKLEEDKLALAQERDEARRSQQEAEMKLAAATGMCPACENSVRQCMACLTLPAQVANIPCGHRIWCVACDLARAAEAHPLCWECRAPVTGTLRVW